MLPLLAAVTLLIHASGPLPPDPRPSIEAARQLAIAMGCDTPAVSVAWRGERGGMEITVRCLTDKETTP